MVEIYLDEYTCVQSGISYWEGHSTEEGVETEEVAINVGSLMHWRRAWDSTHRRLFAGYVASGEALLVKPTMGPGWFEVTNTPPSGRNTLKFAPLEPLDFREVLRAD
jgi:hypothetical protein